MLRAVLIAYVLLSVALIGGAKAAGAQELTPGFTALAQADASIGEPLELEHEGDIPGSVIARTTTGLLYWQPGLAPSWTDGHKRLALGVSQQLVEWSGDELAPPLPRPEFSPAGTNPGGYPIGGALGQRIYCIENIESGHGRFMYNPTPIYNGEHAQGWLGFIPSTAARWGASIGNRASEWAAAARMIGAGAGGQFAGIAWGRC